MTAITFTSSPTLNQTRVSNGYSWYWTGTKWKTGTTSVAATVGTVSGAITYSNTAVTGSAADTIHAFTTSGTLTLASNVYARILVVAGGGGGNGKNSVNVNGRGGGGGGGGGLLYYSNVLMTTGTYTITVGTGGERGYYVPYVFTPATNGSNSSIIGGSISYTAVGGGAGGGGSGPDGPSAYGGNGGSGGGGSASVAQGGAGNPGTGISGQGHDGSSDGGGGGAWSVGLQADGGLGIINDTAGFPMSFSGGGGNGANAAYVGSGAQGFPTLGGGGGTGVGRYQSYNSYYAVPTGTTITDIGQSWSYGGGGGGSREGGSKNPGYPGFQGIVVVRYPNTGYNIP